MNNGVKSTLLFTINVNEGVLLIYTDLLRYYSRLRDGGSITAISFGMADGGVMESWEILRRSSEVGLLNLSATSP